jgi:hypothetical protein
VLAGALPTNPRDAEALTDEDVSRYWLQQLDGDRNCPWMPA